MMWCVEGMFSVCGYRVIVDMMIVVRVSESGISLMN